MRLSLVGNEIDQKVLANHRVHLKVFVSTAELSRIDFQMKFSCSNCSCKRILDSRSAQQCHFVVH